MADGCEEIEGLTVVDIVRRAKMEIVMISVTGKKEVTSSHGVTFLADVLVDGEFVMAQKDVSLAFRGSRNQRILDCKASLKSDTAVWLSEYNPAQSKE